MSTTIRSALGEQTVQSQPIRTFTVPDASQDQFDPLPDNLPVFRGQAYQETPPQSSYNAPQPSRRSGMGSGSMGELKAQEEAMARARAAKFAPSRLSPAAKARIDALCGISRVERLVDIDGQQYGLNALKNRENREALLAASQFDGTIESPFEIRKQLLARSLFSVAGTDIDVFLGDSSLEARLDLVDELPELVCTKLFDEYNIMFSEIRDKYFPKTEEDVKEVLEDLKK